MARMIPPNIDPETKSNAEKKLFRLLRDMPDTADWTVIHSLTSAVHPTQTMGEADFVTVIPGRGVFVLEVKGGGIHFIDGSWYSTDKYQEMHSIKNPQTEANNEMRALIDYISVNVPSLEYCLFGYGVVFPDCMVRGELTIPDLANEQIADETSCTDIRKYLLSLSEYYRKKASTSGMILPDRDQCASIVSALRPEFTARIHLNTMIRNIENGIVHLTQNQQDVFDGLLENDRCLVKGGAGTGKTILAMNLARKLSSDGKRVALFCYNTMLADYLKKALSDCRNIVCGSFTEYAEETAEKYYPDRRKEHLNDQPDSYYDLFLPDMLFDAVTDGFIKPFDCLIIDEAQDLMKEEYLSAFDSLLIGELRGGQWMMFMDADRQSIFDKSISSESVKESLRNKGIFYTSYTLKDNCRNSLSIISKIDELFSMNTKSLLSDEYGYDVQITGYRSREDEAEKLTGLLNTLLNEGIKKKDIAILSVHTLESSCVALLKADGIRISGSEETADILFSTVHRFKGLERPVIILTDIDNIVAEYQKKLLYVGMSRARSLLYIFANDRSAKIIRSGKGLYNDNI